MERQLVTMGSLKGAILCALLQIYWAQGIAAYGQGSRPVRLQKTTAPVFPPAPPAPVTPPRNPYQHKEILDPEGRYQLQWLVNWQTKRINFEVTVATRGFVVLGLSLRSEWTAGADLVIGGVTGPRRSYFGDYHTVRNSEVPVLDKKQDWVLHSSRENETHTFLSFSRPFDTCDEQDIPIDDDARYILWGYGNRDNESGKQFRFENRGAFLTYIRDPERTPLAILEENRRNPYPTQTPMRNAGVIPQGRKGGRWTQPAGTSSVDRVGDAERWELWEQFDIPPKRTTYWCHIHKLSPSPLGKRHMIGYNWRINAEARNNMHHALLFRCVPPPGMSATAIFEQFMGQDGQECYDMSRPLGPMPTTYCTDLVLGHAIGGKPTFFPDHIGIPLGQSNQEEYYMLQVHYDNPTLRSDIQSRIQFDIYHTANLRSNDGGILSLGHHIPGSGSILVPPGEKDHKFYGHCSPSCTQKMLPPQGIKLAGGLLHTHEAGRRIRLQHFRNGKELRWISNDDNYQFVFQPTRLYREEVTILPGDQVSVQCHYETTPRNRTTMGGYGTDQEMCKTFLLYYSKLVEYPICRSEIQSPDYWSRYLAGTRNVTWDQSQLEDVATAPPHVAGMTLSSISDSRLVNWNGALRQSLRRDHIVFPHQAVCPSLQEAAAALRGNFVPTPNPVSFPVEAIEYQPPIRCALMGGNID